MIINNDSATHGPNRRDRRSADHDGNEAPVTA
jgi:hypothetical protein